MAITQKLKKDFGPKLKDFKDGVARTIPREITDLRQEVRLSSQACARFKQPVLRVM